MKVIVNYNKQELDGIIELTMMFNRHVAALTVEQLKYRIFELIDTMVQENYHYIGTYGFLINVEDVEESDGVRNMWIRFLFDAGTYARGRIGYEYHDTDNVEISYSLPTKSDDPELIVGMISDEM